MPVSFPRTDEQLDGWLDDAGGSTDIWKAIDAGDQNEGLYITETRTGAGASTYITDIGDVTGIDETLNHYLQIRSGWQTNAGTITWRLMDGAGTPVEIANGTLNHDPIGDIDSGFSNGYRDSFEIAGSAFTGRNLIGLTLEIIHTWVSGTEVTRIFQAVFTWNYERMYPVQKERITQIFSTSTTAHVVNMPTTVIEGEVLVVGMAIHGDPTTTPPAGWTEIADASHTANTVALAVYAKDADGTEGGTTVDFVTSAAARAGVVVYRLSDVGFVTKILTGSIAEGTFTQNQPFGPSLPSFTPNAPTLHLDVVAWDDDDDDYYNLQNQDNKMGQPAIVKTGSGTDDVTLNSIVYGQFLSGSHGSGNWQKFSGNRDSIGVRLLFEGAFALTQPRLAGMGSNLEGTTTVSNNLSSLISVDDLMLMIYESAPDTTATSLPTGWTRVPPGDQNISDVNGTRLTIMYKFFETGDDGFEGVSVSGGDHMLTFYYVIRGVDKNNPFESSAGGTLTDAGGVNKTIGSAFTPTRPNTFTVWVIADGKDNANGAFAERWHHHGRGPDSSPHGVVGAQHFSGGFYNSPQGSTAPRDGGTVTGHGGGYTGMAATQSAIQQIAAPTAIMKITDGEDEAAWIRLTFNAQQGSPKAATSPKPGMWAATRANVDPHYQRLWDHLYVGIPLWEQDDIGRDATDKHPLSSFGSSQGKPYLTGSATEIQANPGVWGTELVWTNNADPGDGIMIDQHGTEFVMTGAGSSPPTSAALLFKWDGTTGDERSLISQEDTGSTFDMRYRIENAASPADLLQATSVVFANAIVADRWYLLAVTWREVSTGDELYTYLQDLTDGGALLQSDSGRGQTPTNTEPLYFGAEANNDASTGLTVAGAWAWRRPLEDDDIELLSRDPFGMFRPSLAARLMTQLFVTQPLLVPAIPIKPGRW